MLKGFSWTWNSRRRVSSGSDIQFLLNSLVIKVTSRSDRKFLPTGRTWSKFHWERLEQPLSLRAELECVRLCLIAAANFYELGIRKLIRGMVPKEPVPGRICPMARDKKNRQCRFLETGNRLPLNMSYHSTHLVTFSTKTHVALLSLIYELFLGLRIVESDSTRWLNPQHRHINQS